MTAGSDALTHLDADGRASMVDVSAKNETRRRAVAQGFVRMAPATLAAILAGNLKKGDVFATSRIAGIMAAKRTHELIPLCHPLPLSSVSIDIEADEDLPGLQIRAEAVVTGRTGVEMEALTGCTVACLTVYDMAKALDRFMVIGEVRLLEKSGGASGDWRAEDAE